ncbi:MAG: peptidylprolyl isomerase [Tissierellia bacterium]|nr:peptidylprolyl isomerase [Tissierellia bacterium]
MELKKTLTKGLALVVVAGALLTACGQGNGDVAATVNGVDIPMEKYVEEYTLSAQQAMAQNGDGFLEDKSPDGSGKTMGELLRENTLANLVQMEIIRQDAEKAGITVDDQQVEEQLNMTVEMYGGEEAFTESLEAQGFTMEKYREFLANSLFVNAYTDQKVKDLEPTEEELNSYYEEHKAEFETVDADHILVETEEEALEVKKALDEGADFTELAKEKSTEPGAKESGGALGTFGRGQMVPEFEEAVFAMEEGAISEPVKTEFGYHIIKLNKINGSSETLEDESDEVKEQVKATVTQTKLTEYVSKLEKDAKVKRHVDTKAPIEVEAPKAVEAPEVEELPEEAEEAEQPQENEAPAEGAENENNPQ